MLAQGQQIKPHKQHWYHFKKRDIEKGRKSGIPPLVTWILSAPREFWGVKVLGSLSPSFFSPWPEGSALWSLVLLIHMCKKRGRESSLQADGS